MLQLKVASRGHQHQQLISPRAYLPPCCCRVSPVVLPWRFNGTACPRQVDPMILEANTTASPKIMCTYMPDHVLFSCSNLRLQGLSSLLMSPNAPAQTPLGLAVGIYNSKGAFIKNLTRNFAETPESATTILVPNRAYKFASPALSTATMFYMGPGGPRAGASTG